MKKRIYAAGSFRASKLFWLPLLAGLVLILLGYSAITALDKAGVRRVAQQTLSSMSGRLQRYENYMANEKSKSLIRLLDKANELSRCLAREQGDRSALLASYTHQQRLTGIFLLNDRLGIEARFSVAPIPLSGQDQANVRAQVESVVQHPKKTYLTRLTTSGGTFDFAAVARQDGPGAVVAYVRKETAEFSEDDISLDTMFLGDNYNLDGVVVVSDGSAILASNKSALQGTYSAEFLDRFHQQLAPDRSGFIHLSYQGQDWYGSRTSSGDCLRHPHRRPGVHAGGLYPAADRVYCPAPPLLPGNAPPAGKAIPDHQRREQHLLLLLSVLLGWAVGRGHPGPGGHAPPAGSAHPAPTGGRPAGSKPCHPRLSSEFSGLHRSVQRGAPPDGGLLPLLPL